VWSPIIYNEKGMQERKGGAPTYQMEKKEEEENNT
jgi:hypothetical protein